MLGPSPEHICAEINTKRVENAVFENPDIRPPVQTLVRGLQIYDYRLEIVSHAVAGTQGAAAERAKPYGSAAAPCVPARRV